MVDPRLLYISKDQITRVSERMFGLGNNVKIHRFKQKIWNIVPDLLKEERIKTYLFLDAAVFDYYKCRVEREEKVTRFKREDEIAGISPERLNAQQKNTINERLVKGFKVGRDEYDKHHNRTLGSQDVEDEVMDNILDLVQEVPCFEIG